MDLEARLRAFAAVARRGSFSRAAEELAISQPAISKHVADLEASLGTRLLIREPRGARLTPAGEFLAGYVSRAEALLAQAAAGMASIAGADSGSISIAASGTPGVYLLPRAIAAFSAARPEVDVRVLMGTSAEALEMVRNHRAELGVVGGGASAPDLEVEPLVEDDIVVVGASSGDDPAGSVRELERRTWVWREEGSATRLAVEQAMANLGIRPTRHLTLPDWEMIKIAVASHVGVAAISRFAVERELADGRLLIVQIPGWHVVRPLSIVRSRGVPMTPLAEHLAAALRRVVTGGAPGIDRARAALAYAERADGHASLPDIKRTLQEGLDALVSPTGVDELLVSSQMLSLLAFWQVKEGNLDEASATLVGALQQSGLPAAGRADLRARLGWLTWRRDDHAGAAAILEEALRESHVSGNAAVERRVLLDLATTYSELGRHARARELLVESMEQSRVAGDIDELLRAYNNGPGILDETGDLPQLVESERFLREGIDEANRAGDRHHIAWMSLNLSSSAARRGDLHEAEQLLREALRLFEELHEAGGIGPTLVALASVRLRLGDSEEARALAIRSRTIGAVGRPWLELEWAGLEASTAWPDDQEAALRQLRLAVGLADRAVVLDSIWITHLMIRMAFRVGAPMADDASALDGARTHRPEERTYGRWANALANADGPDAIRILKKIARDVEACGAPLVAAEAHADAAIMARRARRNAEAGRFTRERDRLLGLSGAVPVLDPSSAG